MLPKDWASLFEGKNVNEMWQIFKEHLNAAIKESIPQKTVIINGRAKRGRRPDKRVRAKIKRKKRLWDQYIRTTDAKRFDITKNRCKIADEILHHVNSRFKDVNSRPKFYIHGREFTFM